MRTFYYSLSVSTFIASCSLLIEPTPESLVNTVFLDMGSVINPPQAGYFVAGSTAPYAGMTAGLSTGVAGTVHHGGMNDIGMNAGINTQPAGMMIAGTQGGTSTLCVVRIERCNDLDDDCDGRVDEDFEQLGEACEIGLGRCRASGYLGCGETESNLKCLAPELSPNDELCDEEDNDCDGSVDEEVLGCCIEGMRRQCGLNLGSCTFGEQSCVNGLWELCSGTAPQSEQCDGADNDCDGLSDEGLLNACGRCGLVPSESCDGEDNDCDGVIDEGVTNACGLCTDLPVEVCDGIDNDCDGNTDERVQNACGDCGAVPNELCDGEDNDCDGDVDEALTADACTVGVGACRNTGIEVCQNGQYQCNVSPSQPQTEVCDGRDNDCDGQIDGPGLCDELCNGQDEDEDGLIDEGVLNACGACGEVPAELCNGQDDDCDGQIDEGVLNRCGACGQIPAEVCNGQDDDCDGQSDEGVLNLCGSCGAAPVELCNNQDDDCDGAIDETFPQLGQTCTKGVGECMSEGVYFCYNNSMYCSALSRAPQPEDECDDADNDCDGLVDENIDFGSTQNCGRCGKICAYFSNTCINGECFCGTRLPPCCDADHFEECSGMMCDVDRCVAFCSVYQGLCY